MSPSQKDDDGQEWEEWELVQETVDGEPYKPASYAIREKRSGRELENGLYEAFALQAAADHRDAQQLREQLEEAQDELKFVNLRKEEKLRDNLMHALGHTKDDGHTYEQHELGQLLEDVFYHYRDELPLLREQRDHSAVRGGVWAARAGLYASQRDKALERVRVLEEALRKRGKCFHCQGTGKPNCVTCDDYQACRCRPGEGRYAEHCWNCKGTGLNAWAAALLSPAAATEEAPKI